MCSNVNYLWQVIYFIVSWSRGVSRTLWHWNTLPNSILQFFSHWLLSAHRQPKGGVIVAIENTPVYALHNDQVAFPSSHKSFLRIGMTEPACWSIPASCHHVKVYMRKKMTSGQLTAASHLWFTILDSHEDWIQLHCSMNSHNINTSRGFRIAIHSRSCVYQCTASACLYWVTMRLQEPMLVCLQNTISSLNWSHADTPHNLWMMFDHQGTPAVRLVGLLG